MFAVISTSQRTLLTAVPALFDRCIYRIGCP